MFSSCSEIPDCPLRLLCKLNLGLELSNFKTVFLTCHLSCLRKHNWCELGLEHQECCQYVPSKILLDFCTMNSSAIFAISKLCSVSGYSRSLQMGQREIDFWLIMLILHLTIFGVDKLQSTLVCPLFGAVLLEARCILHVLFSCYYLAQHSTSSNSSITLFYD